MSLRKQIALAPLSLLLTNTSKGMEGWARHSFNESLQSLQELIRDIVKSDRFNVKHLPGEFYDATNIVATSIASCTNPKFPGEIFIFT